MSKNTFGYIIYFYSLTFKFYRLSEKSVKINLRIPYFFFYACYKQIELCEEEGGLKMKKLQIVFDIDGVLADTQTEILARYNKEYGLNYSLNDITCWNLEKIQKPGTDMIKYFKEPGFFASLKPVKGAQEIIECLSSIGDELFVATSSPIEGLVDKVLWVREHFPQIPSDNICLITRKDILCGDIILDDALHNLHPTNFKYPIVFDRPWNRKGGNGFIRVYDWYHFYEVVQKIREGCFYSELLEDRQNKKRVS